METSGISGQTSCQHDGTEEVSDQVITRAENTVSGHKATLYFFPKATRGLEPVSYRGVVLSARLLAIVYVCIGCRICGFPL
jgi:hypothetical protein